MELDQEGIETKLVGSSQATYSIREAAWETPVLKSLFNKVASLIKSANSLKRDSSTGVFLRILRNF